MSPNIEPENRIAITISGIFVFIGILFYVIFPPLKTAAGIYTILSLVSLVIYSLSEFQDSLVGINLEKLGSQILYGLGVALVFITAKIMIPGFSIGIPITPESVSSSVRAIILLGFAPVVETILTVGALLGFISYMESGGVQITKTQFWIANISQSIFFASLHLFAYVSGWYNAPTTGIALAGISAESSAFVAAFFFSLLVGFVSTRKEVRSLVPAIVAHFVVNSLVFVQLAVVGLPFTVALPLSIIPMAIIIIIPKKKYLNKQNIIKT